MNEFFAVASIMSPLLIAVLGIWAARTNRRLNEALESKARSDLDLVDVSTEEAWQRLYSKTVEELERTKARLDAIVSSREDCERKLAVLEDELTLHRAEIIRLGGNPRHLETQ